MSVDLLAFGPHPDDVELSCGGWLTLAAQRGQSVVVVDLTAGELATNGTVEERAAEAQAAAELMGVARENLGLPDGGLREEPEQIDALVAVLRKHQPSLVLAPWTQARHPDHTAAGHMTVRAVFLAGLRKHRPELGEPFRPTRLLHYPQRVEAKASFVVDISSVVERKAVAIAAHKSQFGGRPTLLNSTASTWEVRDRYWGASIGVHAGEPYVLGGPVPLPDPVAHFADHPQTPALVPVS